MPIKKYAPEEIIKLLRLVEIETGQGKTTAQSCRDLGFTEQSYYRWRKEYGGLKISQAKRLGELSSVSINMHYCVALEMVIRENDIVLVDIGDHDRVY